MTKILEKAIVELKKAPPDVQDAIAVLVLAELQDEGRWKASFEQTTETQWEGLADSVRKEIADGDTYLLDDLCG